MQKQQQRQAATNTLNKLYRRKKFYFTHKNFFNLKILTQNTNQLQYTVYR